MGPVGGNPTANRSPHDRSRRHEVELAPARNERSFLADEGHLEDVLERNTPPE